MRGVGQTAPPSAFSLGDIMGLSREQFNQMVTEHTPLLTRICVNMVGDKHEAEDIVQEAFSSAWRSRALYRPEYGTGKAWLAKILKRRVVDNWRKPTPMATLSTEDPITVLSFDDDPLCDEYSPEVSEALADLPECYRETLLLVVVDELTHQEAADQLGIPIGTALSRVSKAKKRMYEQLGDFRG